MEDLLAQRELEQFDHLLKTTRSVRRNLDFERPVEPAVVRRCIDVAVQAPTGLGGENWRFVVVQDAHRKAAISALYKTVLEELLAERGMPMKPSHAALVQRLHEIPIMIFVCVDGEPLASNDAAQIAYYGSIMPAAWSLMLALRARGIGTTWTSLLSQRPQEIGRILELPHGARQVVMLPAGYTKGARLKPAERAGADDVTYWDVWGNAEAPDG